MYLLDTVALSELRKRESDPGLVAWMNACKDTELFLSVLTVGEIRRGICLQEHKNPNFAAQLSAWLETLLLFYGDRVLPVTIPIANLWGEMSARLGNSNADVLLAATAQVHGLTVITRNIKHFAPTGVACHNPWSK